MPTALTYPGVYIEEIPSGVRTITGVATSVTAFIGRTLRGPVNKAITINSFGDFERTFGGLWLESSLAFAVRDFFLNGGGQAVVVRLFHPAAAASPPSKTPLSVNGFTLEAAYEGSWGSSLRFTIDALVSEQTAQAMNLNKTDLFNITVREVSPDGQLLRSEQFRNLSVKNSARRVDKVLLAESKLVRWKGAFPPNPLPDVAAIHNATPQNIADLTTDNITRAERAVAAANKQLTTAQAANPPVPADITAAQNDLNTANANLTKAKDTSDGSALTKAEDFTPNNAAADKKGLYALDDADIFNLLCIPPYVVATGNVESALVSDAAAYCEKRRAMLLVDPLREWNDTASAKAGAAGIGTNSKNAALFFPRLIQPNPLHDNQLEDFAPCGAVAGVFARTDTQRGVWKAPAGLEATLVGVPQLSVPLTDAENGELNPLGINCLRAMPAAGRVVWGSRTMQGDDRLASEWKYIPVRRTALYIEESLYRGTHWVVFEPNDEPLWAQIRLNVGAFMHNLFRQGAFQGQTPKDAYFVKCDKETTTQNDINLGIVNIIVGFAPLKPAEFVVLKLQQMTGQIDT